MTHTELPHAAERIAELRATLFGFRETHPTQHIYLMLDNNYPVAAGHPLRPAQLASRPIARRMARIPGPTGAEEWQPMLLQVYEAGENGYADEALLDLSLTAAWERHASINGAYVAAWIGSELEPAALATHLARNCEQFDPSQGRRRRLPLYEPHRLALLIDDQTAFEFAQWFLSQTPLWIFVDSAGSLRTLLTMREVQPSAASRSGYLSLDMGAAQRRVSNARLALLGAVKADLTIPAQIERKLDKLLVEAAGLGLTQIEDVVFFALNGLSLSPMWHLHPSARQCIARTVNEQAPLAGLLSELSDSALDEIGTYRPA